MVVWARTWILALLRRKPVDFPSSREVSTIKADTRIFDIVHSFLEHPIRRLPVVDETGHLVQSPHFNGISPFVSQENFVLSVLVKITDVADVDISRKGGRRSPRLRG